MPNILQMSEYDKVVRRFVDDYVNNLTPDQMRELILALLHILTLRIYAKILQVSVFEEMG